MQKQSMIRNYVSLGLAFLLCGLTAVWADEAKPAVKATPAKAAQAKDAAKPAVKAAPAKAAASISGSWSGFYKGPEGGNNAITMDIVQNADKVTGTITVDAGTLPIEKGVYDAKEKRLSFEAGPSAEERYQIAGTVNGDAFAGNWKGGGQAGTFSLSRGKKAETKP